MPKADFSNLKALDITNETEAEYTFRDIVMALDEEGTEAHPSAFFAPALEQNKAFNSARTRMVAEEAEELKNLTPAQRKRRIMATDEEEDRERERWRVLISETCARRWGNPLLATDGKVHELDSETCYAFLSAMPIQIFDPFRNWIANPYNFFDRRALVVSGDALGNSSPTGSSGS